MENMNIYCNTWSDKAYKGIVVNQNIIYLFSKSFSLGECSAMQCNRECRLPEEGKTNKYYIMWAPTGVSTPPHTPLDWD